MKFPIPPLLLAILIRVQQAYSLEPYYYETTDGAILGAANPEAAIGNPLKGLLGSPSFSDYDPSIESIPASLEFYYIPFNELMFGDPDHVGMDAAFDWSYLEERLNDSASRNRHAVLTVTIHYPGRPLYVPQFLWEKGLNFFEYTDFLGGGHSPDYGDPNLLKAIEQFIAAFGAKYDADKRIAFIHLGLLGFWGEWHTHPVDYVPDESRRLVVEWYAAAFHTTKLQNRYPFEPAYKAGFGLTDGSFGFETLDGEANGGVYHPKWYFWPTVENANMADFWKTSPMGGETRPEIQNIIFEPSYPAGTYKRQDFMLCVNTTHATYILHQDVFKKHGYYGQELERTRHAHSRLGYNFVVSAVAVAESKNKKTVVIDVTIKQIGVAPFYYPLNLVLNCPALNAPKKHTGVETILSEGDTKGFRYKGVPATSDCLERVSLSLDSPYAYEGRPIKFAQGPNGRVTLNLPTPDNTKTPLDPNITDPSSQWDAVKGFTLIAIEPPRQYEVGPLHDGGTVNLAMVGYELSIRADISKAEKIKSVLFSYNGTKHQENVPPYALAGDILGEFKSVDFLSYVGTKVISATAYDTSDQPTRTATISINVVDTVTSPTRAPVTATAASPFPSPVFATAKVPAPVFAPPESSTRSVPIPSTEDVHGFNTPSTPPILDLNEDERDSDFRKTIIGIAAAVVVSLGLCIFAKRRRRAARIRRANTNGKDDMVKHFEGKSSFGTDCDSESDASYGVTDD